MRYITDKEIVDTLKSEIESRIRANDGIAISVSLTEGLFPDVNVFVQCGNKTYQTSYGLHLVMRMIDDGVFLDALARNLIYNYARMRWLIER